MNIEIIEAASDLGVTVCGAEEGPHKIAEQISKEFCPIDRVEKRHVIKEVQPENKRKNIDAVNEFNTRLYQRIKKSVNDDCIPITIGGDHSIAIATALGSIQRYQNLGLIWVDAHGDYNTFDTTLTGNIHGLPLAVVTEFETHDLASFHKGNPFYSTKNTVIIGARDIDNKEQLNLLEAGVTIFTTEDIRKQGVKAVVEKAMKIACNHTEGLHISFDIDVIDPEIAPGVSVPAIDGITKEQAEGILEEILEQKQKIKSMDIVEYNPEKDDTDKKTEKIVLHLLGQIINKLGEEQTGGKI